MFSHFMYDNAAMWLKCAWHTENTIFTQNFVMSMIPKKKKLKLKGRKDEQDIPNQHQNERYSNIYVKT